MAGPRASVIVAAYHSASVIGECLDALGRQTITDFETIVVNSSPGDGTRDIVASRSPRATFVEHPTRLLPHAARNLGVGRATGDVLVFTDADCRPAPDWLAHGLAAVGGGHDVVAGSIEPATTGWYALGVHLCKYSFRLSTLRPGPTRIAGTANAFYSRSLWNRIGPFDGERFAGDAMLGWRATAAGAGPWFEPSAVVTHVFAHTLTEFWSERVERGADFLSARATSEAWSKPRLVVLSTGFAALALVALGRTVVESIRGRRTGALIAALPLIYVGHLAWSIGEAKSAAAMLRN